MADATTFAATTSTTNTSTSLTQATQIPTDTTITITVDFTGGLEMLFDNITHHTLTIPAGNDKSGVFSVGDLVPWLLQNLMRDSRKELFVLDGAIRPGILVLINEADWELEGEDKYELKEGDNVLFVSTLHGG